MANDTGDEFEMTDRLNPRPTPYEVFIREDIEVSAKDIEKARNEMEYQRHFGGFGYKQAKRTYERLLRKFKATERKESGNGN